MIDIYRLRENSVAICNNTIRYLFGDRKLFIWTYSIANQPFFLCGKNGFKSKFMRNVADTTQTVKHLNCLDGSFILYSFHSLANACSTEIH